MNDTFLSPRPRLTIGPRLIITGMVIVIMFAVTMMYITRDLSPRAHSALVTKTLIPAPDFKLASLDGNTLSLSDFRGHYVLVNFWASWCPPCKAEMPDLQAYYQDYQGRGFRLLAVNVQESKMTVNTFMRANKLDFPVALDYTGAVYNLYGEYGLPSSFLIDPDGNLVKMWRPGAITRAMLERDVTLLLGG